MTHREIADRFKADGTVYFQVPVMGVWHWAHFAYENGQPTSTIKLREGNVFVEYTDPVVDWAQARHSYGA